MSHVTDPNSPPTGDSSAWGTAATMRIVLCTVPPQESERIATALVEHKLAACVNLIPGLRSVYRWKGAVANDPETLMMIKTLATRLDALRERIVELHPYDVPELLTVEPSQVSTRYLGWLSGALEEAGDDAT